MPTRPPKRCKRCPATVASGATISWRGLCRACALTAVADSVAELRFRRGAYYQRWEASMAARFGAGAPEGVLPTLRVVPAPKERAEHRDSAAS